MPDVFHVASLSSAPSFSCWALTQAACDAATRRNMIRQGLVRAVAPTRRVNGGATMPALVYPDTTTAVC